MIADLAELIDTLCEEPKPSRQPGRFSRRTFFNARAGRPISFAVACQFLTLARKQDPGIVGLRLVCGKVIYAQDALEALLGERAQLLHDNAVLAARVRQLERVERVAYGRLASEGRAAGAAMHFQHSAD